MVALAKILEWFKAGLEPTENQFRDTWTSFWHKSEKLPIEQIFGLKEEIAKVTTNFKGYHSNLSELQTAYPQNENKKDWYAWVGSPYPGTVWKVNQDKGAWIDTGEVPPQSEIDLAEYTKNGGSEKTLKQVDDEIAQLGRDTGVYVLAEEANVLKNFTSKNDARLAVPYNTRKPLLTIIYNLNGVAYEEQYIQQSIGDSPWTNDINWINKYEYVDNIASLINSVALRDSTQGLLSFTSRNEARNSVIGIDRKIGKEITYLLNDIIITEQFTGLNVNFWLRDQFWKDKNTPPIYTGNFQNRNLNIENYIKGVSCTSSRNLGLTASFTLAGEEAERQITLLVCEYDNNGIFKEWIARKQNLYLSTLTRTSSTIIELDKYTPAFPDKVFVTLDVNRMLSETFDIAFTIGSSSSPSNYDNRINSFVNLQIADEGEGVNSLTLNCGKFFPLTSVNENWGINSAASRAKEVFNGLLDAKIEGANVDDNYVYVLELICKNRESNAYGNGIVLSKRDKPSYGVVDRVILKSLSSDGAVKEELDKIPLEFPKWIYISAFGLKFSFLVDGTYIGNIGEVAITNAQPLYGSYLDESCYIQRIEGGSGINEFATVMDAALDQATGIINVGTELFKNTGIVQVDNYSDLKVKPIEDNYIHVGLKKKFPPILKSELIRVTFEGISLKVSSFSDKYIYSVSEWNEDTNATVNNILCRADKDNPTELIRITLPSPLPEEKRTGMYRQLYELADGDLLFEVENGDAFSSGKYRRRLYRLNDINTLPVIDNVLNIPEDKIQFITEYAGGGNSRMLPAWNIRQYGNKVIFGAYGSGRTGVLYYSKDNFKTYKTIFNMGKEDVFVDTKLNTQGGLGAYGGHPMPDTVIPANSFDWSTIGGVNAHIHGVAYDEFYNRIWVVTGDGGGVVNSVTGIWYSDDEGITWHRVELGGNRVPYYRYGTQMITIIPLDNCVLFATDGSGDGFWRYTRNGKNNPVVIELAYQYTGSNTGLAVIGAGWYITKKGFVLSAFNPDNENQGDYANYKGGVVATATGFQFDKIYEDEFIQGTKATAEIDWLCTVNEDSEGNILLSAANGGIIKLFI